MSGAEVPEQAALLHQSSLFAHRRLSDLARSPETTFCLRLHSVLGVGDGMVPTQFDEALV